MHNLAIIILFSIGFVIGFTVAYIIYCELSSYHGGRILKQSTFRIYHHKVTDIKPKIEVFETKAQNKKDALNSFRDNFGTLSIVDFVEKEKH